MTSSFRFGPVLRFLADENFNLAIVRGVRDRNSEVDVPTVQDLGMQGIPDPEILQFAAETNRIVLTHDFDTMPKFAYERLAEELPMPGLFLVSQYEPIGPVMEDILLLAVGSVGGEWNNRVGYLPLR